MELQGERLIPASIDKTWVALNDPATLKACIAGCETLDRTGDDAFAAVVAVKVGPVSARFRGNLKTTDVKAPESYTIHFDGQGGVAGFGKGSADVKLTPEGPQRTRLGYVAKAQVGGRLAQIGSRLVDAAAGKIAEDFFKAFEAHVQAGNDAAAAPVAPAAVDDVPASAHASTAAPAPSPAASSEGAAAPSAAAGAAMAPSATSDSALWWVAGAVAVGVLLYSLAR